MYNEEYNSKFYDKHFEGSYRSAEIILSFIFKFLQPNSVIDFGCGIGTWCLAAKRLGIPVVYGIDSNSQNRRQPEQSQIYYKQSDIGKDLLLDKKFDLAISMEVGEHIPEEKSDIYIHNLVSSSEVILFSAAIPGQEGLHHINEQPLSYWVKKFGTMHFQLVDSLRGQFWNNNNIEIWYRNNIVLFVYESKVSQIRALLPPSPPLIDIVHPELFERKVKKYKGRL